MTAPLLSMTPAATTTTTKAPSNAPHPSPAAAMPCGRPHPAQAGPSGSSPSPNVNAQVLRSRPRFATPAPSSPPTGSATVAASMVTVIGSMTRMHIDATAERVSTNPTIRVCRPVNAVHNDNTGLPSPPTTLEEHSKCVLNNIQPPTATTSTPSPTNPPRPAANVTVGPSVPLRRGVVVGAARKQARRKRAAIIPTAAAAAQQAAATTKTTVLSPPPSPKQPQEAAQEMHKAQSEPQQEPPAQTQTRPEPVSPAEKVHLRRFLIKPTREQEMLHIQVQDRCARPPITSCGERTVPGSMYCHFHSCKATNQDMQNCPGLVYNPEESRFCPMGYHADVGQGVSEVLVTSVLLGDENARLQEHSRNTEREQTLAWFEDKFGPVLNSPLPVASISSSPSSTSSSLPTYTPFRRHVEWGSTYVDKWWEGNWAHRVSVPLELQVQADIYHYFNPRYSSSSSEPYGPSRPTSPVIPSALLPGTADPMAASLMSDYRDRLNGSSRWQPKHNPHPRPAKLRRHLTA